MSNSAAAVTPQMLSNPPSEPAMRAGFYGYGFNVGARYEVTDAIALGFSYVSKVRENIDGTATAGPGSTGASGQIQLPQEGSVGLMIKPMDKLSVELGVTVTGWKSYDELAVTFANPALLGQGNGQRAFRDRVHDRA